MDSCPILLSHANVYSGQQAACFKHSNFFKVNKIEHQWWPINWPPSCNAQFDPKTSQSWNPFRAHDAPLSHMKPEGRYPPISGGPKPLTMTLQDPTTSFSTAAELIYAIGAGITAAAGQNVLCEPYWVKEKTLTPNKQQQKYHPSSQLSINQSINQWMIIKYQNILDITAFPLVIQTDFICPRMIEYNKEISS